TVVADGNVSFAGTLTNTGTIDMDDGATGDVLTVTASAANAGTFLLDLNLNTGTADQVIVTGGGVTSAFLDFNIAAGLTFVGGPITVFSGAAAGSLAGFATFDLPEASGIIYALDQSGDDIQVVSLVNPAVSGVAAAAAVTQSLIATVVNRPTSPFVSGLAAEETCSSGGYARATGGKATAAGTSISNGISVTNDVSATYGGIQGGYDFGCFDGRYGNGWDGAIGIMGGVNFGSTKQNVYVNPLDNTSAVTGTSGADFNQSYLGVYVAASKDKMSGDVQLRFDRTEFELNEADNAAFPGVALVGFDGAKFDTQTTTVGARANYRIDLNEANGISVVPTVGFNYSRTSGDTVEWVGGGKSQALVLEPYNAMVGFVGATMTRTRVAESGTSATTLFASGNYYHDFSGNRDSTFFNFTDNVVQPIQLEGLGGFGEASIGVNYVRVLEPGSFGGAKQFNANIRADARFGGNVSEAYSLTAQMRLSF
ncbi:MAG: autotransporter domain-containing protein, partial [Paracoccaceae bacterium]